MIKILPMTWAEQRIDSLIDWIGNLANPDIDPTGIREWYWAGKYPQVMFENPPTNSNVIFIAENSLDTADKQYPLLVWRAITMDFSEYVKAKNIFYVTWSAGDTLSIIVR